MRELKNNIMVYADKRYTKFAELIADCIVGEFSSLASVSTIPVSWQNERLSFVNTDGIVVIAEDEQRPIMRSLLEAFGSRSNCPPLAIYDFSDTDEMFLDWYLGAFANLGQVAVFRSQVDVRKSLSLLKRHNVFFAPYMVWSHTSWPHGTIEEKLKLCYFRGSVENTDEAEYRSLRELCINQVQENIPQHRLAIYRDQFLPVDEYLSELSNHRFSICPPGTADITWRHLESCRFGTIPIRFSERIRQRSYYAEIFSSENSILLPVQLHVLKELLIACKPDQIDLLSSGAREVYSHHNMPENFASIFGSWIFRN